MSAREAAAVVAERAPGFTPRLGLVLGSGLGALADELTDAVTIPYADLPGFRVGTVSGHAGALTLGHLDGVPVACLRGRSHVYEGIEASAVTTPIRTLKLIGAEILVLTNAAGSLRPETGPGSLVALTDHINLQGFNPLMGPNDEDVGPRFPSLSGTYDPELRAGLHRGGRRARHAAARRRLPRRHRPELRDPGGDPRLPHARRRPRRDVDRARGDRRRATAACASPPSPWSPTSPRGWATSRSPTSRRWPRASAAPRHSPRCCDDGWRARLRHPRDARRCASP